MTKKTSPENRKRILVVEDNAQLAQTYRDLFHQNGYEADIAANGVQALKFILGNRVDAVICDLTMPQLEGDMFHLTVKRMRPELGQRFVFVTGNQGNPKFEEFLQKSGCPVLYKPVSVDKLIEVVGRLFDPA